MQSSPFQPARLFGNIVVLLLLVFAGTVIFDYTSAWFGRPSQVFCSTIAFVSPLAFMLAVMMGVVGIILLVVTRLRSELGFGLVAAGVFLRLLPLILPYYVGVSCLPSPVS